MFLIAISSYLNFHKNACKCLEEKEQLHPINDVEKVNDKLFPGFPHFPPQWVNNLIKKTHI